MERTINFSWAATWISLGLLMYLIGCSPPKKMTPDRNFYFEIINHGENESSRSLAEFLKEQIPTKKYTITNYSGLTWPFYKELKVDESISQDSLMPPHWYLHKMTPLESIEEIKQDEFLVRIDLLPHPDTLPNYSVKIFRKDSTHLILTAESGTHYIDSTEFNSESALFTTYLRSIIRYSFK